MEKRKNKPSDKKTPIIIALVVTLLMVAFIAPSAMALQVTPAKIVSSVDDTPKTYSMKVINDGPQEATISVTLEGDLKKYGHLPSKIVLPPGKDSMLRIDVDDLKGEPLSPGLHELIVALSEQPMAGGTVGATAELAPKIVIRKPYNGPYLTASWSVQEGTRPLKNTIMIVNNGNEEGIANITLKLSGPNDSLVSSNLTGPIPVPAGHTVKKEIIINPEVENGDYYEELSLNGVVQGRKKVVLGLPIIKITGMTSNKFFPGELAKITITTNTTWNHPLNATILPSISNGTKTWNLEDKKILLSGTNSMTFYWESSPGRDYVLKVKIRTPRNEDEFSLPFKANERLLEGPSANNRLLFIVLLVFILVLIVIMIRKIVMNH